MNGNELMGHRELWREWNKSLGSDRMHHAWLLVGRKGLGKGTFARSAAERLVSNGTDAHVDAESHPDILILEPLPNSDEEAKKRDEGKPYQTKRNITVEQIRAMQRRLNTRPTMGSRRAIIIDCADDLEKGAVNALLKSLEEPPNGTSFILVSHQPGRLVPTVRSRCRILRFTELSNENISDILDQMTPQADATTRVAAIAAAQGSPGLALGFVGQELGGLNTLMLKVLQEGDRTFALRGAMAEEIGARPDRERLLAVLDLARATLSAALHDAPREQQLRIIEAHQAATRLAAQVPTYNFDAALLVMEIGGLLASAAMPRETAV